MFDKYKTRGAYHYDWYKENKFYYRNLVDKCVEFCKGSTLDVGCGEGLVVDLLTQKGLKARGIDNNETGLLLGKDDLDLWLQDIEKPLQGWWEYMVCLNVIEHLEHPERIKQIFNQNITKAAIIITDIPQPTLGEHHIHEFTPYELKQMFYTRKVKAFKIGDYHGIEVYK